MRYCKWLMFLLLRVRVRSTRQISNFYHWGYRMHLKKQFIWVFGWAACQPEAQTWYDNNKFLQPSENRFCDSFRLRKWWKGVQSIPCFPHISHAVQESQTNTFFKSWIPILRSGLCILSCCSAQPISQYWLPLLY